MWTKCEKDVTILLKIKKLQKRLLSIVLIKRKTQNKNSINTFQKVNNLKRLIIEEKIRDEKFLTKNERNSVNWNEKNSINYVLKNIFKLFGKGGQKTCENLKNMV